MTVRTPTHAMAAGRMSQAGIIIVSLQAVVPGRFSCFAEQGL
jgi:hypothetical protein